MAYSTTIGRFPWDVWLEKALHAGMNEATARTGRAMMRECHEHDWERFMGPPILQLCGFEDAGENMIAFGLAHPDLARRLWAFIEEDDAGENPRSRTPKELQPLIMQSFRDRAFPVNWQGVQA